LKDFILKEYGSWSVLILSYLAGLLVNKDITPEFTEVLLFLSLSLFMNSKQSFTRWMRNASSKISLFVFILQIAIASLILILIFREALIKLLPLVSIPIAYLILLKYFGEHLIITEITGFIVLTLSALISKFAVTGILDYRLYICITLFFTAGIFKVRVFLKKRAFERVLMVLYVALSIAVFSLLKVPIIILLPLIDNLIFSATLYKVKLKTTGWIEVSKGIVFLILLKIFFDP
jgi:hypothetical protein